MRRVTGDNSVVLPPLTLAGPSVSAELRTLWTNRLPPNILAIIATQAQVALDDVGQLADKIAKVTPPLDARVSSYGIDWHQYFNHPYWRVGSAGSRTFLERLSSAVTIRHDGTQDVRHCPRDGHQPFTSSTTSLFKSVQIDAPRPVRGSRETWMAVASDGEQLLQLGQRTLCDGSAHKIKLLGRHRRRSLRWPTFIASRTPDTVLVWVVRSKWHYCTDRWLHLDLGLRR